MATFNGNFSSVSAIKVPDKSGTQRDVFQIKSETTGEILWRKNITYIYKTGTATSLGLGSFALYYDENCTESVTPKRSTDSSTLVTTYSYTVPYGTIVYWRVTSKNNYHFETNGTDHTNPSLKIFSYNYKSTGANYINTTTLSIPNLVKDWYYIEVLLTNPNYGTFTGTNNGITTTISSGSYYWVQYGDKPTITATADSSSGYYFYNKYGTSYSYGQYADNLYSSVTSSTYNGTNEVTFSNSITLRNDRYIKIVNSSSWTHPLDSKLITDSNMNLTIDLSGQDGLSESISIPLSNGTFKTYAVNATYKSSPITITVLYELSGGHLSFSKTGQSTYSLFSFQTTSTDIQKTYSVHPNVYAWECVRLYAYGGGSANNGGTRAIKVASVSSAFSCKLKYNCVVIKGSNGDWNTTIKDNDVRYPYIINGSLSLSTTPQTLISYAGRADWFVSVKMGYFETCAKAISSISTGYVGTRSATTCTITCANSSPGAGNISSYKFPTVTEYTLNFGVSWCYENFSSDSQRSRVPASDSYPDNDYAQIYSSSNGTSTDRDARNPSYGSNGTNGTAKAGGYQYTSSTQNSRYVYSDILLGT